VERLIAPQEMSKMSSNAAHVHGVIKSARALDSRAIQLESNIESITK